MDETDEIKSCDTCLHWKPMKDPDAGRAIKGQCRRGPPTVMDRAQDGVWPITLRTEWCGEWAQFA